MEIPRNIRFDMLEFFFLFNMQLFSGFELKMNFSKQMEIMYHNTHYYYYY